MRSLRAPGNGRSGPTGRHQTRFSRGAAARCKTRLICPPRRGTSSRWAIPVRSPRFLVFPTNTSVDDERRLVTIAGSEASQLRWDPLGISMQHAFGGAPHGRLPTQMFDHPRCARAAHHRPRGTLCRVPIDAAVPGCDDERLPCRRTTGFVDVATSSKRRPPDPRTITQPTHRASGSFGRRRPSQRAPMLERHPHFGQCSAHCHLRSARTFPWEVGPMEVDLQNQDS